MKKTNLNFQRKTGMWFCIVLLTGMVACGGESEVADSNVVEDETVTDAVATTDAWDENRFNSTFASNNYYEEWDENDDNMLDQNEYNSGIYDTWDINNDNRLDENEWKTASNDFGLENETWSEWDTSADGALDENEFATGMGDNSWFGDSDADNNNLLNEREYTDGLFGLWDNNGNGMLEENEYSYYNTYYGS